MEHPRAPEPWLPDLCRLRRVGAMLGLAELVVVVVALVPDGRPAWTLSQLLSVSGYALWLALAVSVLLCVSRGALSRLPIRLGALAAICLAAGVAWLAAAIVHGLYASVGAAAAWSGFWRFTTGSAAVTALIAALALRYFYVTDRWQAQVSAHARAEADALQARIRPHFLFNSMNMIASLLRRDPVVAERAVLDLADLFRASLTAGEGSATLAEEVELVERYLAIEQLRLGERLRVDWRREEPLPWSLPMPRLVLQPLLENAVLHGISRLPEGGTIEIVLRADARRLHVGVRNPSPPPAPRPGEAAGAGHARRSVAHRLAWAFGPEARMTGGWDGGYYACTLELPLGDRPGE
ncbi:histidine kinase [Luteimonas sp. Y-2-2-4F]|nr:histidine kinase [Luteimonas sp. Y-2-2-4F]MCD9033893.1 histidine kinase [Luteimonas sp. Y-2-2-4F]